MEQLTARQLAEWEAFYTINPSESQKEDIRFSFGLSTIANLLIRAHFTKGAKLYDSEDFLINWVEGKTVKQEEKEKTQSVEDMKNFLLSFAKTHNRNLSKNEVDRKSKRLKK